MEGISGQHPPGPVLALIEPATSVNEFIAGLAAGSAARGLWTNSGLWTNKCPPARFGNSTQFSCGSVRCS